MNEWSVHTIVCWFYIAQILFFFGVMVSSAALSFDLKWSLTCTFYLAGCTMTVVGLQVLKAICRPDLRNAGPLDGLQSLPPSVVYCLYNHCFSIQFWIRMSHCNPLTDQEDWRSKGSLCSCCQSNSPAEPERLILTSCWTWTKGPSLESHFLLILFLASGFWKLIVTISWTQRYILRAFLRPQSHQDVKNETEKYKGVLARITEISGQYQVTF